MSETSSFFFLRNVNREKSEFTFFLRNVNQKKSEFTFLFFCLLFLIFMPKYPQKTLLLPSNSATYKTEYEYETHNNSRLSTERH